MQEILKYLFPSLSVCKVVPVGKGGGGGGGGAGGLEKLNVSYATLQSNITNTISWEEKTTTTHNLYLIIIG